MSVAVFSSGGCDSGGVCGSSNKVVSLLNFDAKNTTALVLYQSPSEKKKL